MIIVNFCKCEKEKDVSGLWQYDYGQILRIQGLDLPTAVEIHFSLQSKGGDSKTRVGVTRDGVTDVVIPDSMLENNYTSVDYSIYAFIYLTDETSGQTEYKICMRVRSRSKLEAFDTPEDAELFREAIAAVNESAERAETSEKNAAESETKAAEHLEEIETLAQRVTENTKQVSEDTSKVAELTKKAEKFAEAAKRGVQADLSINDEENPTHVKGRTHWVEGGIVEILPETQIVRKEGASNIALELTYSLGLKKGEKYIVNYNGVKYECVALDIRSVVGTEAYILGNASFIGLENTGEPFVVMDIPAGDDGVYGGVVTEVECSFSIWHDDEVVHKLPNKFLDLAWLPTINRKSKVLLPEQTLPISDAVSSAESLYVALIDYVELSEGQSVYVEFNGVGYDCTALRSGSWLYVGNGGLLQETGLPYTREPFLFTFAPANGIDSDMGGVYCTSSGEHTFAIYAKDVNKMPEEFLPESIDSVILRSSTEGSTKKFILTVDDEGIPTISEITEE